MRVVEITNNTHSTTLTCLVWQTKGIIFMQDKENICMALGAGYATSTTPLDLVTSYSLRPARRAMLEYIDLTLLSLIF